MTETVDTQDLHIDSKALSHFMEFDHIIYVDSVGIAQTNEMCSRLHAPELHDSTLMADTDDWSLLNGFSGQYGYSGPMMHSSEFIGGGLARHILSNPGYYVALVNYDSDSDDLTEWAIAYLPAED